MHTLLDATRPALLALGVKDMKRFCEANGLPVPGVVEHQASSWRFQVCAYYRRGVVHVCLEKCAAVGLEGRAWSYPGYAVDRTPYGVVLHELGHHVDVLMAPAGTKASAYWSDHSTALRNASGEPALTTYCENDAEWFAEIFRLFVANPDLLRSTHPRTYGLLVEAGLVPIFEDTWDVRLKGAPERTLAACRSRITTAARTTTKAARTQPQGTLFDLI
jgi:hypothetical protein